VYAPEGSKVEILPSAPGAADKPVPPVDGRTP
jgi:hypothetical protein